jgi:predicted nucleotide-binding protein
MIKPTELLGKPQFEAALGQLEKDEKIHEWQPEALLLHFFYLLDPQVWFPNHDVSEFRNRLQLDDNAISAVLNQLTESKRLTRDIFAGTNCSRLERSERRKYELKLKEMSKPAIPPTEVFGPPPYAPSATGPPPSQTLQSGSLDPLPEATPRNTITRVKPAYNNQVFIVHGHDGEMKAAVARTIEKLKLEAIILHEKPNAGKTIIEKFIENAKVGFAVVLLSPDDFGYAKTELAKQKRPRPRQNVVLELGFFIGKLGRERVCALIRDPQHIEPPSDILGVGYTPYDSHGAWMYKLVDELKAAGYKVSRDDL